MILIFVLVLHVLINCNTLKRNTFKSDTNMRYRTRSSGPVVYFVSTSRAYPSFGDNPGMVPWSIFCVDIKSEVDKVLQPKVRLTDKSFDEAAFCILESTLYVFEGYTKSGNMFQGYTIYGSRSIYCYKLKPGDSNLELSKSMMKKVGVMNNDKYSPMAVPTPDGRRIIVASCFTNGDFEIFNPKNGKCRILTRIDLGDGYISSYAFLSKHVLLVQIRQKYGKRNFALDLKATSHWKECLNFSETSLESHSLIFGNDICLTPSGGYYIDGGCKYRDDSIISKDEVVDEFLMGWYLYPDISSLPKDIVSTFRDSAITLIAGEDKNGACEFCIFNMVIEKTDEWIHTPHIMLDIYRCNLNVCREGMKKLNDLKMSAEYSGENEWKRWEDFTLPGATKMKSLKFCIKPNHYDYLIVPSISSYNVCP